MAAHHAGGHKHRRIEGNFSQGWVTALLVTALAVAAFVGAGLYKKATYHDPALPVAGASGTGATPAGNH